MIVSHFVAEYQHPVSSFRRDLLFFSSPGSLFRVIARTTKGMTPPLSAVRAKEAIVNLINKSQSIPAAKKEAPEVRRNDNGNFTIYFANYETFFYVVNTYTIT